MFPIIYPCSIWFSSTKIAHSYIDLLTLDCQHTAFSIFTYSLRTAWRDSSASHSILQAIYFISKVCDYVIEASSIYQSDPFRFLLSYLYLSIMSLLPDLHEWFQWRLSNNFHLSSEWESSLYWIGGWNQASPRTYWGTHWGSYWGSFWDIISIEEETNTNLDLWRYRQYIIHSSMRDGLLFLRGAHTITFPLPIRWRPYSFFEARSVAYKRVICFNNGCLQFHFWHWPSLEDTKQSTHSANGSSDPLVEDRVLKQSDGH